MRIDLDKVDPKNPRIEVRLENNEWEPALVLRWHSNGLATVMFEDGVIATRRYQVLRGIQ